MGQAPKLQIMARFWLQSLLHNFIFRHVAAYPPGRVHGGVPPNQNR
jgi:hypothetical protein